MPLLRLYPNGKKINEMKNYYLYLVAAGMVVSSCVTRKYSPPAVQTDRLYRNTSFGDSVSLADIPWQQLFTDTILRELISEGLKNNLDMKVAMQRMAVAQAGLTQSKAAFYPSLVAGASVTRAKASSAALNLPAGLGISLGTTVYQAQLASSWEADIWGRLGSAKRGALAGLLESQAARKAVQSQLIAAVAGAYYELLALDRQLEITHRTITSRTEEATAMKALKESAIVNGAAVVQSEANRYAAEVSVPDLERAIRETENGLCVLLARTPGVIVRSSLAQQVIPETLNTGLPVQLLHNRPDVMQAAFVFRGAFERTNTARTFFYPALTITAQGGLTTLKLADLFNGSVFYNLVGGLTQPVFSQGLNKARLTVAQAQQEQAALNYQQVLLRAGQEVSDFLFSFQAAKAKEVTRARQLEALERSVVFNRELLRYSTGTNYTDVLTSEQGLLAAQLAAVNDRLQQLHATVGLYQALGGGWKD